MATTLNIANDAEKNELTTILQKAIQSANLNFIIGSGCSVPAIETLGNIEKEVQECITAGNQDEADRKLFGYLQPFIASAKLLRSTPDANHASVLGNYRSFLTVVSEMLFKRNSNIIPKQATIFSTNYDLFVEKASEFFSGSLKLNDGFTRNPSLENTFYFSIADFFTSIYNNGNLYNYEVQIPSINLIKLHGSLSWLNDSDRVVFSVEHLDCLQKEMEAAGRDAEISKVRELNDKFSVILPNKNKFRDTLLDRYHYDLLRIYANELDKENTLLVAEGFSFDDEHILDITVRALRNPTLRLVIFCFTQADAVEYEHKFGAHATVDIVFSKEKDIQFGDFSAILNNVVPREPEKASKAANGAAE